MRAHREHLQRQRQRGLVWGEIKMETDTGHEARKALKFVDYVQMNTKPKKQFKNEPMDF